MKNLSIMIRHGSSIAKDHPTKFNFFQLKKKPVAAFALVTPKVNVNRNLASLSSLSSNYCGQVSDDAIILAKRKLDMG